MHNSLRSQFEILEIISYKLGICFIMIKIQLGNKLLAN